VATKDERYRGDDNLLWSVTFRRPGLRQVGRGAVLRANAVARVSAVRYGERPELVGAPGVRCGTDVVSMQVWKPLSHHVPGRTSTTGGRC